MGLGSGILMFCFMGTVGGILTIVAPPAGVAVISAIPQATGAALALPIP